MADTDLNKACDVTGNPRIKKKSVLFSILFETKAKKIFLIFHLKLSNTMSWLKEPLIFLPNILHNDCIYMYIHVRVPECSSL